MDTLDQVLEFKEKYRNKWRDQPEDYWLARLMQEVGELASSLAHDHDDPPELELTEIASICLNWLDMRHARNEENTETN
ncbi:hypothetical protein KC571_01170 [candidate division WWE3 bacterium]|uniref:Uncharacterized protein n=1 Tax=candidate division WWE3 bacterium TaxID=2053526 RepID=A0A955LG35_UNCKA|nr:hypothetical protein [candidate division WWE3 bacterium]